MSGIYRKNDLVRIGYDTRWGIVLFADSEWAIVRPLTQWRDNKPDNQDRILMNIEELVTIHLRPPARLLEGENGNDLAKELVSGDPVNIIRLMYFGFDILLDETSEQLLAIIGELSKTSAIYRLDLEKCAVDVYGFEHSDIARWIEMLIRGGRVGVVPFKNGNALGAALYRIDYSRKGNVDEVA